MSEWLLEFLWPPRKYRRLEREDESEDRRSYLKFYREVYIPWLRKQDQQLMEDFKKPLHFAKFIS